MVGMRNVLVLVLAAAALAVLPPMTHVANRPPKLLLLHSPAWLPHPDHLGKWDALPTDKPTNAPTDAPPNTPLTEPHPKLHLGGLKKVRVVNLYL